MEARLSLSMLLVKYVHPAGGAGTADKPEKQVAAIRFFCYND